MKKIIILSFILIFITSILWANPFAAKKTSVTLATPAGAGNTPTWLISSQGEIKSKLAKTFNEIKIKKTINGYLALLLLAFTYGVLHAGGPGHRKSVVFSIFITKKAHWWEPLYAGFLLAAIHAFTSVAIVLSIKFFAGRIFSGMVNQTSTYLDIFSYSLLGIVISIVLAIRLYQLFKNKGHHHHHALEGKSLYSTIFITGAVPCPGATLIMIFAVAIGMTFQGILAILAMSIGMGITISLAGILALLGKETLFKTLKKQENKIELFGTILEISGLVLILLIVGYMLLPLLG